MSNISLSEPVVDLLDELLNEEATALRFLIQNGEQEASDVERYDLVNEAQQEVAQAQLARHTTND